VTKQLQLRRTTVTTQIGPEPITIYVFRLVDSIGLDSIDTPLDDDVVVCNETPPRAFKWKNAEPPNWPKLLEDGAVQSVWREDRTLALVMHEKQKEGDKKAMGTGPLNAQKKRKKDRQDKEEADSISFDSLDECDALSPNRQP